GFSPEPTVNGVIGDGLGGGDFGLVAAGTLNAVNTYRGRTIVWSARESVPRLRLGANSALSDTSAVVVPYARLELDNTALSQNHLPESGELRIRSGSIALLSANPTPQRVDTIRLMPGFTQWTG